MIFQDHEHRTVTRGRGMLGAALVISAVALTGCGSAPPPPPAAPSATAAPPPLPALAPTTTSAVPRVPPEKQDETFRAALARRGLTVADTPADTAQYGRIVCAHLDADEPVMDLANQVRSTAQLDPDSAGYVLGASAAVYCPDDLAKLPAR